MGHHLEPISDEGELAAVVAHGLLNTLAVRLTASTAVLRAGLQTLVRGLPPETIDLLDSLQHR